MKTEWRLMTELPEEDGRYEVCLACRGDLREYYEWAIVDMHYINGSWFWDDIDDDGVHMGYGSDDEYHKMLTWRKMPYPTPPEFALEELQEMNRRVVT